MGKPNPAIAQRIAESAVAFQRRTTGHAPRAVMVVLSQDTLVITLHDALSAAEKDLAVSPQGAANVEEFHRQLFRNSSQPLLEEIRRITGVDVREAVEEIEPPDGSPIQAFTASAVVQVFRLAETVPGGSWTGPAAESPLPEES